MERCEEPCQRGGSCPAAPGWGYSCLPQSVAGVLFWFLSAGIPGFGKYIFILGHFLDSSVFDLLGLIAGRHTGCFYQALQRDNGCTLYLEGNFHVIGSNNKGIKDEGSDHHGG
jgi:hypothetical protein